MSRGKWYGLSQFVMVGQLGLSLIMPLLLCLFICWFMSSRLSVGSWVFIPGFFFGLGGSMMTAWKVYLSVTRKQEKEKEKRTGKGRNEVSFSRHL